LFTVGEIDELWFLGDVFEMDLAQLREGQEVRVRVPGYPNGDFKGRIDWVSDVLDPVMRTAKVRAVLDNPNGVLRPEMYQEATIDLSRSQLLAVPREALLRLGEQTVVFVSGGQSPEGKELFKRRRVLANEEKPGGLVPILEGLKPGESVVTRGAIFLVGLL
jgi:multidrug efflux pump subunit AcrA (membrane-fusion protein)